MLYDAAPKGKLGSELELTRDTPYLPVMGELCAVYCEY